MKNLSILALALTLPTLSFAAPFKVGTSRVDITPKEFELRPLLKEHEEYKIGDPFFDTGVDQLFDFEEAGAFGFDGKPGIAGVDDDGDGIIDNCDRKHCKEYLTKNSDDVKDPHSDNYSFFKNPKGTEGDGQFQFIHMGGFSPYFPAPLNLGNRIVVGVHDPLWARALAVQGSNGQKTLLIVTDLPGLVWKYINPVRRWISKSHNIPYKNIIITSTHTHSAPDASGYFVTALKGHNKKYTDTLKAKIYQAGVKALESMQSAQMKVITTTHVSCYDRITKELKKDPDCKMPKHRGEFSGPEADQYDHPLIQTDKRDPFVRNTNVVAAHFSTPEGQSIATFINWHNHPDSLRDSNMFISSDYVHYVRDYVEKFLGGNAVYFTGTLGCQIGELPSVEAPLWDENYQRVLDENGKPTLVRSGWNKIRSVGYEVGSEIVQALNSSDNIETNPTLNIKTEELLTPVNNLIHKLLTKSVWTFDVEKADRMVTRGGKCFWSPGCVKSDISTIELGSLSIVTAPGEVDPGYFLGRTAVTVDYGKKHGKWKFPAMPSLRAHMKGQHHAMLGQANNYLSYLIHEPDFHGAINFNHPNWYEDLVTINKSFGDLVGDRLMKMLGSSERYSLKKSDSHEDKQEEIKAVSKTDLLKLMDRSRKGRE